MLSGFSNGSYAKIKAPFDPADKTIEVVVEFETGATVNGSEGILNSIGKCGFSPLFIGNNQLTGFLSSNGVSWDIAGGTPVGLAIKPNSLYRVKAIWDGSAYSWQLKEKSAWRKLSRISSSTPVWSGANIQFGTGRGLNFPFGGLVDLNRCYICIDGKLWWEGVKGAYRNANR